MITINSLMCKGCGYCIKFCPKHILEMGKERSQKGFFYPVNIDADKCTSCAVCALMCPEGAIEVTLNKENS
ncbi:MAG: ferredoxin family protein [Acutalibacteraceae bacterium]